MTRRSLRRSTRCCVAWSTRIFAKNERDNVDDEELSRLKRLAHVYTAMGEDTIGRLIKAGELMEVKYGESQAS